MLKADSEDTVETGIVKMSRPNYESTGNLAELTLHQFKMLKFSLGESRSEKSASRYLLSSVYIFVAPEELHFDELSAILAIKFQLLVIFCVWTCCAF